MCYWYDPPDRDGEIAVGAPPPAERHVDVEVVSADGGQRMVRRVRFDLACHWCGKVHSRGPNRQPLRLERDKACDVDNYPDARGH